jgi:hypothetical protein
MSIRLNGSSSGYTEIDAPAVAGSNTLTLPTGNGTSGQVLSTNGSGGVELGEPGSNDWSELCNLGSPQRSQADAGMRRNQLQRKRHSLNYVSGCVQRRA